MVWDDVNRASIHLQDISKARPAFTGQTLRLKPNAGTQLTSARPAVGTPLVGKPGPTPKGFEYFDPLSHQLST